MRRPACVCVLDHSRGCPGAARRSPGQSRLRTILRGVPQPAGDARARARSAAADERADAALHAHRRNHAAAGIGSAARAVPAAHRLPRGRRTPGRRLGRGHDVQARPARGRPEPAGRDVDVRHRSAQQPAAERTTGGTHEQRPAQSRARMGHRVSEDRGAAHVRGDHRLDDVLRAGADRQSARARHAQRLREVGVRRRRAAALVAVVRRARQQRQDGARLRRRARQRPHRRCENRHADLEGRSASRRIRRHHRRAGARRQSHHRADLLLRRRPRRRSEVRMLRRSRRGRRARREQRPEAVDRAHDGGREVHRQSQLDGREAARSVRRADLVDAVRRRQTRPRLLRHRPGDLAARDQHQRRRARDRSRDRRAEVDLPGAGARRVASRLPVRSVEVRARTARAPRTAC